MSIKDSNPNASVMRRPSHEVVTVEECAALLIRTIQQLREENDVPEDEEVSLYVTDAPIVHSTLSEYEDDIMEKANLVDVVQVNVKAGNPMPEALSQVDRMIGDDLVTVAIEKQAHM